MTCAVPLLLAGAPGATYSQFLDQVDSGAVQKVTFAVDEGPRRDTTAEALAKEPDL